MQGIPLLEQEGWLRQSIKWREATELGADGVVPLERPATNSFGTTRPARPFLEFDGLAGTPPNSGGEFQTRNWELLHRPFGTRTAVGRLPLDVDVHTFCKQPDRRTNPGRASGSVAP